MTGRSALVRGVTCLLVTASLAGAPGITAAAPQDPVSTITAIQAALARGDLARAEALVQAALTERPADPALHNFAGVIDAQQGERASAEGHFREAIRLAPRAVAPYENLGRLYQEWSATDRSARAKALRTYDALLGVDPASVEALFQSALLHAVSGEFAAARGLLERLPAEAKRQPPALAVAAAVLAGTGDAGAAAAADALAGHPDVTAEDVLVVLPAFEPAASLDVLARLVAGLARRGRATPDLLRQLASLQMRRGQFAEARGTLERVAASGPSVAVLMDLARVAEKMGDHTGALGYLAHARSLEPANAAVHFMFGIVCVEANLGREAYDALRKAVELDPDNPLVNYAMGAVATTRRDPSEALPYFEKYVRLKPEDPRGRFSLGVARFYSQQYDEARRDLEAAARAPETAMGAHYFLGRLARQLNDLETARREIDAALAIGPSYPDAWAELGLIQLRTGEYAAAEASLGKALAIDSDHYAATVNLATLYGRTKDPRREAAAARVETLQKERDERAQDFLRLIQVVPPPR